MFAGTRTDAEREAAVRERDARRVARPDGFHAATVAQWVTHWLVEHKRAVAPKTFEREAQLAAAIVGKLGDARLDKITTPMVGRLLEQLLCSGRADGTGGLAARTVTHIRTTASKIFAAAVAARVIDHNPVLAAKPPRVETEEVKALSADDVRRWANGTSNPIIHAMVLFLA